MRLFCDLQPAGELQGIVLKIHCEKFWLILEYIEIIFSEKIWYVFMQWCFL